MSQAFFHNQTESVAMSDLGQQITDNHRFPRAGHSKDHSVLWGISDAGFDTNEIATRSVIDRFRILEVACEGRGPRNHVSEIGILGRQVESSISSTSPTRPRLVKELSSALRDRRMVHDGATHRGKGVFQRGV